MAEAKLIELSNIYNTIQTTELARHLGMDVEQTEILVVEMILARKLKASVDQIEGIVYFEGHHEIDEWEHKIYKLLTLVSETADDILLKYPQLK